jgi:hypothetical protein
MIAAPFSAIMMLGASVLVEVTAGMTEAHRILYNGRRQTPKQNRDACIDQCSDSVPPLRDRICRSTRASVPVMRPRAWLEQELAADLLVHP